MIILAKILRVIGIGLGYLKLMYYKILYGDRLKITGIPHVCPDIKIHIDKNASITIGAKFSTRNNVILRATGDGNLVIKNNVFFSDDVKITCRKSITISDGIMVGQGTTFFDHNHIILPDNTISKDKFETGEIYLGKDCWIGAMCCILMDVNIENNSIIGAGTVVMRGSCANEGAIILNERKMKIKRISK